MNPTIAGRDDGHAGYSWRIRWYPRAILLALAFAFGVSVLVANGADGAAGRLGGDYPAFYGAGRIVLAGDGDQLYS